MHEEEDAGVWPGYVAAMAGLVQSLLFVSAIMALSLLQVGMLAGKRIDEHLARAMEAPPTPSVPAQRKPAVVGQPVAPSVRSNEASPPRPRGGGVQDEAAEGQLNLTFTGDQVRFTEAAREKLITEIRRRIAQGQTEWGASVEFDAGSALARRAGYLRLMSVRAAMLDSGIDPTKLDIRLLESSNGRGQAESQVINLVPVRR